MQVARGGLGSGLSGDDEKAPECHYSLFVQDRWDRAELVRVRIEPSVSNAGCRGSALVVSNDSSAIAAPLAAKDREASER